MDSSPAGTESVMLNLTGPPLAVSVNDPVYRPPSLAWVSRTVVVDAVKVPGDGGVGDGVGEDDRLRDADGLGGRAGGGRLAAAPRRCRGAGRRGWGGPLVLAATAGAGRSGAQRAAGRAATTGRRGGQRGRRRAAMVQQAGREHRAAA